MYYIVYNIVVIILIAIIICFLKNLEKYKENANKFFNKNKKIKNILVIVIIVFAIFFIYKYINNIIKICASNSYSEENNEIFIKCDEKINEENKYYNNAIKNINTEEKYKTPYILESFSYVDGEWNNGYVIQDEDGNQYVWVPCSNIESEDVVKLDKKNLNSIAFISKDVCYDEEYERFITSALENGGFYVSRYEVGKENGNPVSKKNVPIWYGVTRGEAINILNNLYTNKEFKCELLNGIAYDTMISWVLKNNKLENILRPTKDNILTGNKMYNNIYDIMDNILELTNENDYDTTIVRGFLKNDFYPNNNRYNILMDANKMGNNGIIAFRSMIYK